MSSRLLRSTTEDAPTDEQLRWRLSRLSTEQLRSVVADIEDASTSDEPHAELFYTELAAREASS